MLLRCYQVISCTSFNRGDTSWYKDGFLSPSKNSNKASLFPFALLLHLTWHLSLWDVRVAEVGTWRLQTAHCVLLLFRRGKARLPDQGMPDAFFLPQGFFQTVAEYKTR